MTFFKDSSITVIEDLLFYPDRTFRDTEGVRFSDVWIPDQNGLDLVIHDSFAVSPPNLGANGTKTFYCHTQQTDRNRVVHGARVFELVDLSNTWIYSHYLVLLTREVGALEIPPNVCHRSVSCTQGSVLLNHAYRTDLYDEGSEFHPVVATKHEKLKRILKEDNPRCIGARLEEFEEFFVSGDQEVFSAIRWGVYPK